MSWGADQGGQGVALRLPGNPSSARLARAFVKGAARVWFFGQVVAQLRDEPGTSWADHQEASHG